MSNFMDDVRRIQAEVKRFGVDGAEVVRQVRNSIEWAARNGWGRAQTRLTREESDAATEELLDYISETHGHLDVDIYDTDPIREKTTYRRGRHAASYAIIRVTL